MGACAPAGRAQLDPRAIGEGRSADQIEEFVRAAKLIAGVMPAPLAAQPFAVKQLGACKIQAQARAAEAVDCLAVEALGGLAVADECPRAGLDAQRPVGPAGAGGFREPLQGAGCAVGRSAA